MSSIKDRMRTAEMAKDIMYAAQALEDYFRENHPEVDVWWFTERLQELYKAEKIRHDYKMLTAIAETEDVHEITALVQKGLLFETTEDEKVQELQNIKAELRDLYIRLIGSLT